MTRQQLMRVLLFIVGALLLAACEKEEITPEKSACIPKDNPELFSSDGPVYEVEFNGAILPVQERDGLYVYQGDIIIPKENKGDSKAAIRTTGLWANNIVYYAIDPNLPDQARVTNAIAHWEAKTSLIFKPRTTETSYLYFTPGSGCSSYVGRTGNKQNVTLASTCSTGNTIHEIGHAIGLWHEQSRTDRDEFLTIHWANIQSGREHNFDTWDKYNVPSINATPALDFGSIMMYGSYSFSSNGKPTITRKDGSTFSAQRTSLSINDVVGVNTMYPEPVIDTDKDGIIDSEDKCITEPGPAENQGCPWPDADKDGVPDKDDVCPQIAGDKANNGCPLEPEETRYENCGSI